MTPGVDLLLVVFVDVVALQTEARYLEVNFVELLRWFLQRRLFYCMMNFSSPFK